LVADVSKEIAEGWDPKLMLTRARSLHDNGCAITAVAISDTTPVVRRIAESRALITVVTVDCRPTSSEAPPQAAK
jgi:hypothetical protein